MFHSFRFDIQDAQCLEMSLLIHNFFQIQFINLAILPSFTILEKLLPKSTEALDNIKANLSLWQKKNDEKQSLQWRQLEQHRANQRDPSPFFNY